MDRPLFKLENKLDLDDDKKSLMTIAMHTNTNNTNLYNAKQMESYFLPKLKAYTYGKHDEDDDINGVTDDKSDIIKYFGKALYQKLVSNDYRIAEQGFQQLSAYVNKIQNKIAKTNHFSPIDFRLTYRLAKLNPQQKKNVMKLYKNKKYMEACCVNSSRLEPLLFITYLGKHPNAKFVPSRYSTMADPIGIPDGDTPQECIKNTQRYFKKLNSQILINPKQVIKYGYQHLHQLNHQIINVHLRHPRIHFRKYLTNDIYAIEELTHTANYSFKPDESIDFFNDSCNILESINNYHEVLNYLVLSKMPYLNLINEQLEQLHNGNASGSFASDVLAKNADYGGDYHHQLSDSDNVADYLRYTQHGQLYLKNHMYE